MGQNRKHKEHYQTDLVCMALPCEVCNVIEDKQRVTQIYLRLTLQGNNFCKRKIRLCLVLTSTIKINNETVERFEPVTHGFLAILQLSEICKKF